MYQKSADRRTKEKEFAVNSRNTDKPDDVVPVYREGRVNGYVPAASVSNPSLADELGVEEEELSNNGQTYWSKASLADGGTRQEYSTGAIKEGRAGKGRYDLISPVAMRRLALVYERGAEKYDDRNWEQGIPMSRLADSALRHLFQYIEGRQDEDHGAQAMWNLAALLHTEEMIERGVLPALLGDLPSYAPKIDSTNWRK